MESSSAVTALAALAQDARLQVFRLLVEAGPGGLSAGSIAEQCSVPAPTLSFHLAQLKHAGLVSCRRLGRSLIYAADYAAMNRLVGYLMENCCGTGSDACAAANCNPASQGVSTDEAPARSRRRQRSR